MKRVIVIIAAILLPLLPLSAQKIGFMSTETVLAQIPEYSEAQKSLNKLSEQYQSLLKQESAKVDAAYQSYQRERIHMSQEMIKAKEAEIIKMEREVKERQKAIFGEDGVLAKKSAELLTPIKNRVDEAIQRLAQELGYSLILDVSSLQGVVYKNLGDDLSMDIIKRLK
jgi:outer membrane protein